MRTSTTCGHGKRRGVAAVSSASWPGGDTTRYFRNLRLGGKEALKVKKDTRGKDREKGVLKGEKALSTHELTKCQEKKC